MALIIKDRVKRQQRPPARATLPWAAQSATLSRFLLFLIDSDTTYYAIVDSNNSDFEVAKHTSAVVIQSPELPCLQAQTAALLSTCHQEAR